MSSQSQPLSVQTTTDIRAMLGTTEQRIHEMTCDAHAVNSSNPAEVAGLYDLSDLLRSMLP